MIEKLYHGSQERIVNPLYGYGKPYNDYGLGFYCTLNIDMAKEWSIDKYKDGWVNCYELDFDAVNILDFNSNQYCILNWLTVLIQNRDFSLSSNLAYEAKEYLLENFNVDYQSYDLIIGYRADDSYFSFAQDFLNGVLSYQQLSKAMYLGKLGNQYVLKSKKAFEHIKYLASLKVDHNQWYDKRFERDLLVRKQFFNMEKNKRQKGDLYIIHILDQEIKSNDSRLR